MLETNPNSKSASASASASASHIRQEVVTNIEKTNQKLYTRHFLYGGNLTGSRLKSKKIFLKTTIISLPQTPELTRIDIWREEMKGYNLKLWKNPKKSLGVIYMDDT